MDEWRVRDDVVFCIRGCVGLGGWGMWEGRWEVGGGGLGDRGGYGWLELLLMGMGMMGMVLEGEGRGCGDVMKLDLKM